MLSLGGGLALLIAGLSYFVLNPPQERLHIAPGGAAIKSAPKRKQLSLEPAPIPVRTGPPKRDCRTQFGRR